MSWASDHLNEERDFQVVRQTRGKNDEIISTTEVPARPVYTPMPGGNTTARSTLVDAEGNVIQTWQKEKADNQAVDWREIVAGFSDPIPRAELIFPPAESTDQLMACYPIGDHHMGMLSWGEETGASYDLKIGEQLLTDAINHLVCATPACERAAVVVLGDFLHYDGPMAQTPTGHNLLDADGRARKMKRAAIRTLRRVIETVATRHKELLVVIATGNHDLDGAGWLAEMFHEIYLDNPRIEVDLTPGYFHYFNFGRNLIGVTHGDQRRSRPQDLPGIMAHDQAKGWGYAKHRTWWTGHIHTQKWFDFPGCSVESFRILPPADAWAYNTGYRAARDMTAIVLHREYGEVARYKCSPYMLESTTCVE